jgi:uncharacterized protein
MKVRKVPLRMCVGCREMKPKKELLRVVKPPEGEIAVDVTGRKAGRGAYLCKNESCLIRAIKQKQLERAFETTISDDVVKNIKQQVGTVVISDNHDG